MDPQEKIKFELKELASSVANWDNYRWKVTHAIKQYNEAVKEMVSGQGTPNCDAWVNAYAKYYYIHKRTDEFAASVLAVKTLATEIEKWLAHVDHNVDAEEQKLAAAYYQGYNALKETPEDEHKENCTKEKCMFSTASWLDASYVPTSDAALWVQNIGGKVWGWGVGDPLTAATGTGLAQADQSVPSGLF